MAEPDSAGDDAKAGKKGFSLVGAIVELLIATAIAGALGGGFAFLTQPPAKTTPGQQAASGEKKAANSVCGPGPNLIDLPTIVTNIGSPSDVWVRVEASIVVDGKVVEHTDLLAAQIASDELTYLRTLSVAQIEGPIGLENIRQDLNDRAVTRSNGKVSELILKTLVLQ